MKESKKVQAYQPLLSDEMNDFISKRPNWIARKGNTLFLLLAVILISLSWTISYPDIIRGPLRIVAINSPKLVTAKVEGKLEKLLVPRDRKVVAGEPLAFLQSTANHRQVLALYNWIKVLENISLKDSLDLLQQQRAPLFDSLGEVQAAYQDFENTLRETREIIKNGFYLQKRQLLKQDLALIREAKASLLRQQELTHSDMELQKREYEAKESLAQEKIIAPMEFNQDKSKLLSKRQALEQFNTQVINNNISSQSKEVEILELQKNIADMQQKFVTALRDLKSKLQDWIRQYIVSAPADGILNYVGFLQENQFIQTNQELFYIIPPSNEFYGELRVGQAGAGKIRQGQKVIIRVSSFPSDEFGYLTGRIKYIPELIKDDSSTLMKIGFDEGLTTSYGKTLRFKSNMNAVAEVITDNRRLPERMMGQLRDILRRK